MLASLDLRFPLVPGAPTCPQTPNESVHHTFMCSELLTGCCLMPWAQLASMR